MKIEIDYELLEQLRIQLANEQEKVERLENKLYELNEVELKQRAITLSYRLFEAYVTAIFNSLGFKIDLSRSMFSSDLTNHLGKTWWTREQDIAVTLGATVTEKFRSAFIQIGVVPKKEISEPEEFKL
jgi:hypothetical protein